MNDTFDNEAHRLLNTCTCEHCVDISRGAGERGGGGPSADVTVQA